MTWLVAGAAPALANGGATEVFRQQQGPYEIVIGATPPTPVVDSVHLTVIVLDAASKQPIAGAVVTVEAQGPDAQPVGPVAASNSLAEPQYYDADIPVDAIGVWQFQVAIKGSLGEERVEFSLRVYEAAVNWGAVIAMLVVVLLTLPLVAFGYRSLRGRRRARSSM